MFLGDFADLRPDAERLVGEMFAATDVPYIDVAHVEWYRPISDLQLGPDVMSIGFLPQEGPVYDVNDVRVRFDALVGANVPLSIGLLDGVSSPDRKER